VGSGHHAAWNGIGSSELPCGHRWTHVKRPFRESGGYPYFQKGRISLASVPFLKQNVLIASLFHCWQGTDLGRSNPSADQTSRGVLRVPGNPGLPGPKTAADLDDLDRVILEAHLRAVFFSYSDLAEERGVTAATIRNRTRRLKQSGVMDVILVMNPY
jgi:hypothetical protein